MAERLFSHHQKRFAATVGYLNAEEQFISMYTPLPTLSRIAASYFQQKPRKENIGILTIQKDTFINFLCEVAAFGADDKQMNEATSRIRILTTQMEEMLFHNGATVSAPTDLPVLFTVLKTLQKVGKSQTAVNVSGEQLIPLITEAASLAHVAYGDIHADVDEAIAFGKAQGIAVADRMAFKAAERAREEAERIERERLMLDPATTLYEDSEQKMTPSQEDTQQATSFPLEDHLDSSSIPEGNAVVRSASRRARVIEAQIPPTGVLSEAIDPPDISERKVRNIVAASPSSWQLAVIQSDPSMHALYSMLKTDPSQLPMDELIQGKIQILDHILVMTAGPVRLRNIGEAMRIDESSYSTLLEYFIAVYDTFRAFYYQPATIEQLAHVANIGETPLREYKVSLGLSLAEYDRDEPNLRIMAAYFRVPLYDVVATLRTYAERPETWESLAAAIGLHPTTLSEWANKYTPVEQRLSEQDRNALLTIASRLNSLGFEGGDINIATARDAFVRYIYQPRPLNELSEELTGIRQSNDAEDQIRIWQRRFGTTIAEYPFDFVTENVLRGLAIKISNIPGHDPVRVTNALEEFRAFVLQPQLKVQLAAQLGLRVDRLIYFIDRFIMPMMDSMFRDHERLYRDIAIRLNVSVDKARDELQDRVQQYLDSHGGDVNYPLMAAELGLNRSFLKQCIETLAILPAP